MDKEQAEQPSCMSFEFCGPIWYWKGPAPFHFLTVPQEQSRELKAISHLVTYGWGMIPVQARIGSTDFTTSLFHNDGLYVLPIKDRVRKAERVAEDSHVTARIEVQIRA